MTTTTTPTMTERLQATLAAKTATKLDRLALLESEIAATFVQAEAEADLAITAALVRIEGDLAVRAKRFEARLADMFDSAFDAAMEALGAGFDNLAGQEDGKETRWVPTPEALAEEASFRVVEAIPATCPPAILAAHAATDAATCVEEHYPYRPGDEVLCIDDEDGAHFLERGRTYTVEQTQYDDRGQLQLVLVGMARAWEALRFVPAGSADLAAHPTDDDLKGEDDRSERNLEIANAAKEYVEAEEAGRRSTALAQMVAASPPALAADPEDDGEDDGDDDQASDDEAACAVAVATAGDSEVLYERRGQGRGARYVPVEFPEPGARYWRKVGKKWLEVTCGVPS